MKKRSLNTKLETKVYLLILTILFCIPIIGFYSDSTSKSNDVKDLLLFTIPFLLIFVINNYLLIPHFLLKRRYAIYFFSVVAIVTIILLIDLNHSPRPTALKFRQNLEMIERRKNRENIAVDRNNIGTTNRNGNNSGVNSRNGNSGINNRDNNPETTNRNNPEAINRNNPPQQRNAAPPQRSRRDPITENLFYSLFIGSMFNNFLLGFLIVGFNIAIKYMFKSFDDTRKISELERQNLDAELKYLKAQINPHFFMNTLNNIHALIDFDSDKAKESVIMLSKIMRYVLYKCGREVVTLNEEIEFLRNYTSLMKIRYVDEVEIRSEYENVDGTLLIPPLLLIVLLENAFKHGISYEEDSFINSKLKVEENSIIYSVENKIVKHSREVNGEVNGVGIENLKKRLNLFYKGDAMLISTIEEKIYKIKVVLPIYNEHFNDYRNEQRES